MVLALIGGLLSLLATSLGSSFLLIAKKVKGLRNTHLSVNFSVGLIISASVLLIYPEIRSAAADNKNLVFSALGLLCGFLLITIVHKISKLLAQDSSSASKIILIFSLILHNFPEGMGSGASMMGMNSYYLFTLQTALAAQNLVEGFLVSASILALGFSTRLAVIGGVASGFVELGGALTAGVVIQQTHYFLPFSLCFAGAAMLTAVINELKFSEIFSSKKQATQFLVGLMALPLLNLMSSSLQ
jgi:zinc transporter, ZIP family